MWTWARPRTPRCSFEWVDPRTGPRNVTAGAVETFTVTLALLASDVPVPPGVVDPFPTMQLSLPNATLGAQAATLAAVMNMYNGW
jgi:hypothetical protein